MMLEEQEYRVPSNRGVATGMDCKDPLAFPVKKLL